MKGIVFDIQRNALHDGPGVRTVIFLKGCPFKCVWCCNPESINPDPQLGYAKQNCKQCFSCVKTCAYGALQKKAVGLSVDFDKCTACGACIDACNNNALRLYGYETDADSLIKIALRDIDYYKNTGGGLTLSGGDPLFQFDFAYEILTKAKQNNLNTCIEIEGAGGTKQLEKALPLVDYVYFDYKITDPEDHRYYVGADKSLVIKNLEFTVRNHAWVMIRCVIIPGINDNETHFRAIAEISRLHHSIQGVEIMPYHDFGKHKYAMIGEVPYPIDSGTVPKKQAESWVKKITGYGGKNIFIG